MPQDVLGIPVKRARNEQFPPIGADGDGCYGQRHERSILNRGANRAGAVLRRAGFHDLPRLGARRFARVETVGFDYGQRHAIELDCRATSRDGLAACGPTGQTSSATTTRWTFRRSAKISETALTRDGAIEMGGDGLPNTFVPGRNLVFLTFAAALAYRRGISPYRRRHVRDGLFRLSRLPRRDDQGAAERRSTSAWRGHSSCTRR